jgi:hypothetical protein
MLKNSASLWPTPEPHTNHNVPSNDSVYLFGHNKRGYAVLVMNYGFDNEDENLPGVKVDLENMSALFNSLGFDVIELVNLTNEDLVTELIGKL